jgi:hypothetical protein
MVAALELLNQHARWIDPGSGPGRFRRCASLLDLLAQHARSFGLP